MGRRRRSGVLNATRRCRKGRSTSASKAWMDAEARRWSAARGMAARRWCASRIRAAAAKATHSTSCGAAAAMGAADMAMVAIATVVTAMTAATAGTVTTTEIVAAGIMIEEPGAGEMGQDGV